MFNARNGQPPLIDDFGDEETTSTFYDFIATPTAPPMTTALLKTLNDSNVSKLENDVLTFEIWHQRLAHCSERKMKITQQFVDGIPSFHQKDLPSIVRCRACDVAMLKKAARGPIATTDP